MLDALGRPVVSYEEAASADLQVLHCGDPNCSGGNTIAAPDTDAHEGTSIELDSSEKPVISYWVSTTADLRVLRCGNSTCTSGNSVTSADTVGDVGRGPSLALDAMGRPVVSYYDADNADLKVFRCSDPNCLGVKDADGDALPDSWELTGDLNGDTVMDVDLRAMGADPTVKDIFVEVDWMDCSVPGSDCSGSHSDALDPRAQALLIVSFWCAPERIVLHIDAGPGSIMNPSVDSCTTRRVSGRVWESLARGNPVAHQNITPGIPESIKSANFAMARAPAFHYALFIHASGGFVGGRPSAGGSSGIPGSDFWVSLGAYSFPISPSGTELWHAQTSAFMHELGHNLGLDHGGKEDVNFKPNYLSIMNYAFGGIGLLIGGTIHQHYDYSRFHLDDLNEPALNEAAGLGPDGLLTTAAGPYGTVWLCGNGGGVNVFGFPLGIAMNAVSNVDWDCDGVEDGVTMPLGTCVDAQDNGSDGAADQFDPDCAAGIEPSVSAAVHFGSQTKLHGHVDWAKLVFSGGAIGPGGSGAGVARPPSGAHFDALITSEGLTDSDGDFLTDVAEPERGTSPGNPDSDGDGVPDGQEVGSFLTSPTDPDSDDDRCPDGSELGDVESQGGLRDPLNAYDYFNPTKDGLNRIDDILRVVSQYFKDDTDANPGQPPYAPGYNPNTDRNNAAATPNPWNTAKPDGLQRVQDILHAVNSYFHDCS